MATKTSSQAGKQALMGRLMRALRRSSAAGTLHGQTIARRVWVNSSDIECLDLILMSGPSTAGDIARHTGLTSGAVTGLIDRLERLGLVERTADPKDRRKVLVRVRENKIGPIAALYAPLEKSMPGGTFWVMKATCSVSAKKLSTIRSSTSRPTTRTGNTSSGMSLVGSSTSKSNVSANF